MGNDGYIQAAAFASRVLCEITRSRDASSSSATLWSCFGLASVHRLCSTLGNLFTVWSSEFTTLSTSSCGEWETLRLGVEGRLGRLLARPGNLKSCCNRTSQISLLGVHGVTSVGIEVDHFHGHHLACAFAARRCRFDQGGCLQRQCLTGGENIVAYRLLRRSLVLRALSLALQVLRMVLNQVPYPCSSLHRAA